MLGQMLFETAQQGGKLGDFWMELHLQIVCRPMEAGNSVLNLVDMMKNGGPFDPPS